LARSARPSLLTLLMFPVLLNMYCRLALAEERSAGARFGDAYRSYAEAVPRFLPRRMASGVRADVEILKDR